MNALLRVNDLSVGFQHGIETTLAVKNVSFSVNRGEILAIVGESGSGKSVSALSILQLLPSPPAKYLSGGILFSEDGVEEENLLQKNRVELQRIRGNKIAMIFQEPMTSLNPVYNCGEQVLEAIRLHKKVSRAEAKRQAIEWFEKVKLPEPAAIFRRFPHQLSGGQKQRVMIAMAMCCHPSLLICDEPTTALDVTVQEAILQLIAELQRQQNMGVIFITHDLAVVGAIANRAAVMYAGEIVEQNTTREIFTNPSHPYTRALLACRPANHAKGQRLPVVSDFLNTIEKPNDIHRAGSDNSGSNETRVKPGSPILQQEKSVKKLLEIKELSVWFPKRHSLLGGSKEFFKAVNDVSFDVYEGETLGLVGESGCGKTTLGRALLRLVNPSRGKIIYKGKDLVRTFGNELAALRKEIQIIFQDPYSSLNPRLTIGDAISEPMKVHGLNSNSRLRKEKTMQLLEQVNLQPAHYNRYPHEFSGGQRQRIVIARALGLEPSFIVCDESVSALDISVQAQVLNLLNDLKKEYGFTVIFISHDLSVVRYISDRILVMRNGQIEESGDADEIYRHPKSEYTRKLIASILSGLTPSPNS